MNTWIKYSLWALLLCTSHWCLAQTQIAAGDSSVKKLEASDYFNTASKKYVKEQKIDALKTLDKGLKAYPGDPRLLKLAEELIKEEEKQQQQQQQQQQEQQEQEQQKEQEQKEKDDKQGEKKNEEEQKEKEQQQEEEKGGEEKKPEPGRISEKDAERILDAMDREEKAVQNKVREKQRPAERRTIDKDW